MVNNYSDNIEREIADGNFNRARFSEMIGRIASILKPEDHELLSLDDVRKALHPESESYRGYTTVPIDRIIGSEGRYKDFSRTYLPRRESSRGRWTSIDRAHQRQVVLPAVNLYEIAGYYFVRDGNHRVSVARAMEATDIDAIVVRLDTKIKLGDTITRSTLRTKVIEFEKKEFYSDPDVNDILKENDISFTETGRYDELHKQIEGHMHYLQSTLENIGWRDAIISWKKLVYTPIMDIIRQEKIMSRFPGRTTSDMYIWIVRHQSHLQRQHGTDFALSDAASDYSKRYGKNKFQRLFVIIKKLREVLRR